MRVSLETLATTSDVVVPSVSKNPSSCLNTTFKYLYASEMLAFHWFSPNKIPSDQTKRSNKIKQCEAWGNMKMEFGVSDIDQLLAELLVVEELVENLAVEV